LWVEVAVQSFCTMIRAPAKGFNDLVQFSRPTPRPGAAQSSVFLTELCFGRAEGYYREGGQPVISDDSPLEAPLDLAHVGLCPSEYFPDEALSAAYVISARKSIRLRLALRCQPSPGQRLRIRARAGHTIRVPESLIPVRADGSALAHLDVIDLPSWQVGCVNELWTWEYRLSDPAAWLPVQFQKADSASSSVPVRIYFTAAVPTSLLPRQSFYHIACAIPGATYGREAQAGVWRHISNFHAGLGVTNARGQRLAYWGQVQPMQAALPYINRDAHGLIRAGDSSCLGWADLLRQCFAIHGIHSAVRVIIPQLDPASGLRVPSFTVPTASGPEQVSGVAIVARSNRWSSRPGLSPGQGQCPGDVIDTGGFNWRYNLESNPSFIGWPQSDVEELGRSSHNLPPGATMPLGAFLNHAVVRVKGSEGELWYDPSYGLGPFASLADYEDALLGRETQTPGGFYAVVGYRLWSRTNPATGQAEPILAGLFAGAAPAPPGRHFRDVDPLVQLH
jgi:hypothetical protein